MTNEVQPKEATQEVEKKKSTLEGVALDGHTFSEYKQYCFAHKMAVALQEASMTPKRYQGNTGDCMIAIDMASRLGANPLMVMQNLYVVNGMPAWSAQFVIAAINTSGRFSEPLLFNLSGEGSSLSCYAYTKTHGGTEIKGTVITMEMAEKEGWLSKKDKYGKEVSKWQSMPEQMIQYRAASFFGRLYCPDLLMGIYTEDEAMEIKNVEYSIDPEKPTPIAIDQEIAQKANQQSITFSNTKSVELSEEPEMVEIFDQDEPTEDEKAAILAMEMAEMNEGPDF